MRSVQFIGVNGDWFVIGLKVRSGQWLRASKSGSFVALVTFVEAKRRRVPDLNAESQNRGNPLKGLQRWEVPVQQAGNG